MSVTNAARADNNLYFYNTRKSFIFKKIWYVISKKSLSYYSSFIRFNARHSPNGIAKPLRRHSRKIFYRKIHIYDNLQALKNAKIFKDYLIQPTRNTPSLHALNQRTLTGIAEIDHDIQAGLQEALYEASPKKIYKLFMNFSGPRFEVKILAYAQKKGIAIDSTLSNKKNAINILKNNETVRCKLILQIQKKISNHGLAFRDQFSVCAIHSTHCASQFFQGKDWQQIAMENAKGVDIKIRDAQIVYGAYCKLTRSIKNNFSPLNLVNTYFNVICEPISSKCFESKKSVYQEIINLENGVYDLSLERFSSGHAILIHKEDQCIHIIDSNIGYLKAENEKARHLIKKLINVYSEKNELKAIRIGKYRHTPQKEFINSLITYY